MYMCMSSMDVIHQVIKAATTYTVVRSVKLSQGFLGWPVDLRRHLKTSQKMYAYIIHCKIGKQ